MIGDAKNEQEERLQALFAMAFPAGEPSEDLRRRVAQNAIESQETAALHARRVKWLRLGLAFAGACAIALAAFYLSPRLSAEEFYARTQGKIRDARTAHITGWRILPDGGLQKFLEIWYDNGRWRREHYYWGHTAELVENGKDWYYNFANNTVTIRRHTGEPFYYDMSGFSFRAMEADDRAVGLKEDVRMLGDTAINGRSAHQIAISYSNPSGRDLMTVDSDTGMPIRSEGQKQINGAWQDTGFTDYQFNQPIPDRIFTPNFPKTIRRVYWNTERAKWQKRLSMGLAAQSLGVSRRQGFSNYLLPPAMPAGATDLDKPAKIVIRDLQVNEEGDVFVLYTTNRPPSGYGSPDGAESVTDNLGMTYLPAGGSHGGVQGAYEYLPTALRPGSGVEGLVFDGDQLEGDWFVPLTPQKPYRPRMLTLTLHVHGAIQPFWHFTLPVARPSCQDVPAYMPYMSVPLLHTYDEPMLLRMHYYESAGDWRGALAPCNARVAYFQARSRQKMPLSDDCDAWSRLYVVLNKLGRTAEARQALLHARDTELYNIDKDQIQAALRKECLQ